MYTTFNKLRIGQLFNFEGDTFEKINKNQAIATQNNKVMIDGCIFNFLQLDQVKIN